MANRLLFILILLGIGVKAHCQYYLDMNEDEVRREAYAENNSGLKITEDYSKQGHKYLSWTDLDNTVKKTIVFNSSGYSILAIWEPVHQDLLSTYIEALNNKFVKVSDTEWKSYIKNKIYDLKLRYYSDMGSYIIWVNRIQ